MSGNGHLMIELDKLVLEVDGKIDDDTEDVVDGICKSLMMILICIFQENLDRVWRVVLTYSLLRYLVVVILLQSPLYTPHHCAHNWSSVGWIIKMNFYQVTDVVKNESVGVWKLCLPHQSQYCQFVQTNHDIVCFINMVTLTLKLFVIEIIPSNLCLYLINPSNINLDGECLGWKYSGVDIDVSKLFSVCSCSTPLSSSLSLVDLLLGFLGLL